MYKDAAPKALACWLGTLNLNETGLSFLKIVQVIFCSCFDWALCGCRYSQRATRKLAFFFPGGGKEYNLITRRERVGSLPRLSSYAFEIFDAFTLLTGNGSLRSFDKVHSLRPIFAASRLYITLGVKPLAGLAGRISRTSGCERQFTRRRHLVQQRSKWGCGSSLMSPSAIPSCRSNSCGCEG